MLTTHNVPYALQRIRYVFQEKKWRPFRFSDSGNLEEESSSCIVPESEPFASHAEALAWKARTDEVNVRQVVCINFCSVLKVDFSFRLVDCVVGLVCLFIDLAMTDAFKAAHRFESAAKTTDTCEHIKKSDRHRASDRSYLIVISPRFCGSLHTAHTHVEAFGFVLRFILVGAVTACAVYGFGIAV